MSDPQFGHFQVQSQRSAFVLTLQDFDWEESLEIAGEMRKLSELVSSDPQPNLVIDLTILPAGYAVLLENLVAICQSITQVGGNMAVCLSDDLLTTFQKMRLDQVFDICSSAEDALEKLSH